MITPIRGRKLCMLFNHATDKSRLEMITPIRGRKLFNYSIVVLESEPIRNDNPDKGTETKSTEYGCVKAFVD